MANNHAAFRFPAIEMSKHGKAGFTDNFEFACRSSFSYCMVPILGRQALTSVSCSHCCQEAVLLTTLVEGYN